MLFCCLVRSSLLAIQNWRPIAFVKRQFAKLFRCGAAGTNMNYFLRNDKE